MSNKKHPNAIYYDQLAQHYDAATSPPGAWTPPDVFAEVLNDWISISPVETVFDIGIGTGKSIEYLAERGVSTV